MRLWLKDSERRPDPAPVATDDRLPVLIGTAVWLVALLIGLLWYREMMIDAGIQWWLLTCAIGIGLGLLGLIYTNRRR
ncbi:MAG: DUF2530 domain-containing protein [Burkholderiaceae bacterium]|nr:DUF2530 domain-containing protein [Microbacteriaceae bacterium]